LYASCEQKFHWEYKQKGTEKRESLSQIFTTERERRARGGELKPDSIGYQSVIREDWVLILPKRRTKRGNSIEVKYSIL